MTIRRLSLIISLMLTMIDVNNAQDAKKEYQQSFKAVTKAPDWGYFGPGADGFVKFEKQGLRITLPEGHEGNRPMVGLATKVRLQGDFELTVRYEVLKETDPPMWGARCTMDVLIDLPTPDVATLSRRTVANGYQFFAWMHARDADKGKPGNRQQGFATNAKTGRIRMVRKGAELTYLAAEGDAKEFKPLLTFPFGVEDTTEVRLVAATGNAKGQIDVRFSDLQIRADGMTKAPAPPPGSVPVEPPPAKAYAQEYVQVFKGTDKLAGWIFEGPFADDCVKFEAEGLRVKLPVGWEGNRPGTGVKSAFGVKGDFEITMNFEILQEPTREEAANGGGTRVSLAAHKKSDTFDVATINRSVGGNLGSQFHAWAQVWDNAAQKNTFPAHSVPTKARTGKLRLVRSGPHLYYALAEGPDGEFKYRAKFLFGPEEMRDVRIIGSTAGEKASLDFRVSELRVRADAIPNAPREAVVGAPDAKVDVAAEPAPARRSWLMAGLIIGSVLVLVLLVGAVGVWVFLKSR